jgi:DNA-binding CsgD family transcriptional regulator
MVNSPTTALGLVRDAWRTIYPNGDKEQPAQSALDAASAVAEHMLSKQFSMAYDVRVQQTIFVSAGVQLLLGIQPEAFSLEDLYARMHPDDAPLVAQATALAAEFSKELGPACHDQVFSVDYRLRHQAGHYVRVLRQNFMLQLDAEGTPVVIGGIYTDLTHHKRTNEVRFYSSHPSFAAWLTQRVQRTEADLSQREQQVLDLVLQGLSSAEIAERLCVSRHTVNTHRRNIHRKEPARDLSRLLQHLDV